MVTTPPISMPKLGIDFASRGIQIPTFNIPSDYDLTLPLMGMVEMAAKVDTNYYKWEATASAGNNTAESPNYVAKFNIVADSPIKFLSFSAEGNSLFFILINYTFVIEQCRKNIDAETNC